jgi:hypothetical protein
VFERLETNGLYIIDATTGVQTGYVANPSHDQDAT